MNDELNRRMMQTPDLNKERLNKLKELFPDLFTVEGKLNPEEFKKIIDPELVKETERFEFKWFGKSEAKRAAFTPSKATLIYDESRSVNPEFSDGNMIIEGENLETIKCLLSAYREKIKCIYIDPPYNTGKDFVYSDKWDESKKDYWEHVGVTNNGIKVDTNVDSSGKYHSNWLNMMYSRLLLARQLLKKDGVIFISIDENELHHLKKISDEIFGEENFIALISIENNPKGRKNSKFISICNDYCLIYAREKELAYFIENIPKNINDMILDDNGNYIHNSGKRVLVGENGFNKEVTDLNSEKHYSVYYNNDTDDLIIKKENSIDEINKKLIESGYTRYISYKNGKFIENTYTHTKLNNLNDEQALEFKEDKIFEKNFSRLIRLKSIINNREYDALINNEKHNFKIDVKTTSAGTCIKELFETDNTVFNAPKNIGLIKLFITLFDDNNFITLDFFAGSGTTAHAIIDQNNKDNGNRKFILIQIPELTDNNSEAYKAGFKKISDITIERNKRVIKKIEQEESQKNPELFEENKQPFKTGFKVYKLAKSNFPRVDFAPDPNKTDEENIELLEKYIQEKEALFLGMFDEADIFDEVLLKNGFMLNYSKEKLDNFSKNKVYKISDTFKECLICLDNLIDKETLKELEKFKDNIFICLERSIDTTLKWNLNHLLGDKLIAF